MIMVLKIVNTHGVRGEVKGLFYADNKDFFKDVDVLYDKNGKEYKILSYREQKGALILKIEGIEDLDSAEKIKNTELFAKRESLPKLPQGRYYINDLIGLDVLLIDGRSIGKVQNIFESGSTDVLDIIDDKKRQTLIPNCDEFVSEINLKEGKIYIIPMEGLIDHEI